MGAAAPMLRKEKDKQEEQSTKAIQLKINETNSWKELSGIEGKKDSEWSEGNAKRQSTWRVDGASVAETKWTGLQALAR